MSSLPSSDHALDYVGAFVGTQALGNFVMQCLYAGSIARMFGPQCGLQLYFREDRQYKRFIIKMLRERFAARAPLEVVGLPREQQLELDWFGSDPLHRPGSEWDPAALRRPRFFIMPAMSFHPGNLPAIIAFNIPADDAEQLAPRLESMGLRRDRWFATLHMRELEYEHRFRMDPNRCVDTETYVDSIRLIIEQGGQVVRIGDPSMTALPKIPGFIDLSRLRNSFELQCFAISRARFHLGTDSGPSQIAGALKTPTLITNAIGLSGMNIGDLAMAKSRRSADGRILRTEELYKLGGFTLDSIYPSELMANLGLIDNTAEEICSAVEQMLGRTQDCLSWRADQPDDEFMDTGYVDWPIPYATPRTERYQ